MGKKILLIEDDEFIGFIYKRQLEKNGYEVTHFLKGKEGLSDVLSNKPYDLVLLDVMLPDISGIEILKALKESSESVKKIPVLLLTNLGQEAVIKEAFGYGADGYLIKASYTPDQIVNEVTMFLKQREQAAPADQNTPSGTT